MKLALIRSSGSDTERSPAVYSEAVFVSLSDPERSLATGDAVLASIVSHRHTCLELSLTIPVNLVKLEDSQAKLANLLNWLGL